MDRTSLEYAYLIGMRIWILSRHVKPTGGKEVSCPRQAYFQCLGKSSYRRLGYASPYQNEPQNKQKLNSTTKLIDELLLIFALSNLIYIK